MKTFRIKTAHDTYVINARDAKSAVKMARKLDDEDIAEHQSAVAKLLEALRNDLRDEHIAITNYEKHAQLAKDLGFDDLAEGLLHIRNEEIPHTGELNTWMGKLDPSINTLSAEGKSEVGGL